MRYACAGLLVWRKRRSKRRRRQQRSWHLFAVPSRAIAERRSRSKLILVPSQLLTRQKKDGQVRIRLTSCPLSSSPFRWSIARRTCRPAMPSTTMARGFAVSRLDERDPRFARRGSWTLPGLSGWLPHPQPAQATISLISH